VLRIIHPAGHDITLQQADVERLAHLELQIGNQHPSGALVPRTGQEADEAGALEGFDRGAANREAVREVNGPDTHQGQGLNHDVVAQVFGSQRDPQEDRRSPFESPGVAFQREVAREKAFAEETTRRIIEDRHFIADEDDPGLWELHPEVEPLAALTSQMRRAKFKGSRGMDTSMESGQYDNIVARGNDRYLQNYRDLRRDQHKAESNHNEELAAIKRKKAEDMRYRHSVLMSYRNDEHITKMLDPLKVGQEGRNWTTVDEPDPELADVDPYVIKPYGRNIVRKWNFDEPTTEDLLLLKAAKWNRLAHRRANKWDDGLISNRAPPTDELVRPEKDPARADLKRKYYSILVNKLIDKKRELQEQAPYHYATWEGNFLKKIGGSLSGLDLDNPNAFFVKPFAPDDSQVDWMSTYGLTE
jgi:hypothetical protein